MTQRWNNLLFAHWPVPVASLAGLLPEGLVPDTFDGSAWIGVVPFTMDRIQLRGLPSVPGTNKFPELNLRTYVRETHTNQVGVYFFSLDAANLLAVTIARTFFQLPYFWAQMHVQGRDDGREFDYRSERIFGPKPASFRARYRSLQKSVAVEISSPGTIEHFLTERYRLYTVDHKGQLFKGDIHHVPWPLETAEAEIETNQLPHAHGIQLPDTAPLLLYARELVVYVWSLEMVPTLARGLSRHAALETS
jgi:uncharacterized protein YqjF (DUF2071 family)